MPVLTNQEIDQITQLTKRTCVVSVTIIGLAFTAYTLGLDKNLATIGSLAIAIPVVVNVVMVRRIRRGKRLSKPHNRQLTAAAIYMALPAMLEILLIVYLAS